MICAEQSPICKHIRLRRKDKLNPIHKRPYCLDDNIFCIDQKCPIITFYLIILVKGLLLIGGELSWVCVSSASPPHRDIGGTAQSIPREQSQTCGIVGLEVLAVQERRHKSIPDILVNLKAFLDDTLVLGQEISYKDLFVSEFEGSVDRLLAGVGQEHNGCWDEHSYKEGDHKRHEDGKHNIQSQHSWFNIIA